MDKYNDVFVFEWTYGVWKTTYAVLDAINNVTNNPNAYVFTDIKFKNLPFAIADRIFHFVPTFIGETQIIKYWKVQKEKKVFYSLMEMLEIVRLLKLDYDASWRPRNERLVFYFYMDESGDIFNKYIDSDGSLDTLYWYIVQMRKLNIFVYLISQQYMYLSLRIRILVSRVYRMRRFPLLGKLPFFCNFTFVDRIEYDPENWRQRTKIIRRRNKDWDRYDYEEPIWWFKTIFYKPPRRKYYDDLYMTMREVYPYPLSEYSIMVYNSILSKFKKWYLKKSFKQSLRSIFSRELWLVLLWTLYILWYFYG